jgi:hypothetical protein
VREIGQRLTQGGDVLHTTGVAVGLLTDGAAAGDGVLLDVPLDSHAAASSMIPRATGAALHQASLRPAVRFMAAPIRCGPWLTPYATASVTSGADACGQKPGQTVGPPV